jgi:hypothetical protein
MDGRRQRSERTRQLIIDAYLRLIGRNWKMPTTMQIAEEADCSQRSVFERFADLGTLTLAATDFVFPQGEPIAAVPAVDDDRATRIRSHVDTRVLTCEKWLPLWRVLVTLDQPQLRQRVKTVRLANVARIQLVYGPELGLLPEGQRTPLLIVLGALTSFESWDQLRHCSDLSIDAGQEVWRTGIDRLLPV